MAARQKDDASPKTLSDVRARLSHPPPTFSFAVTHAGKARNPIAQVRTQSAV